MSNIKTTIEYFQKNIVTKPVRDGKSTGGTGGDNAHYGAFCQTEYMSESDIQVSSWPCHSSMKHYTKAEVVFSRFVRRPYIEDANRYYFSWLISPNSPWRDFKGRSLSHTSIEDIDPKANGLLTQQSALSDQATKEWIYQNGWVWSDLSSPSNLQHSFLVASRMPAEWPEDISLWHQRCLDLVSDKTSLKKQETMKSLVFLFMTIFTKSGDMFSVTPTVKYDWPSDVNIATEDYVKNFCLGVLDKSVLLRPYKDDPQYKPVNSIFGKTDRLKYEEDCYPRRLFELYHKEFGLSENECRKRHLGLGDFDYSKNWIVSEEDIRQIIRSEFMRLFGKVRKTA